MFSPAFIYRLAANLTPIERAIVDDATSIAAHYVCDTSFHEYEFESASAEMQLTGQKQYILQQAVKNWYAVHGLCGLARKGVLTEDACSLLTLIEAEAKKGLNAVRDGEVVSVQGEE